VGRLHKGSFDLAKLEPAISRHPSGRISPCAGFCAGISSRIREQPKKFMKPTPQVINQEHARRSFPLTDYNFQATVEAKSSCAAIHSEKKLRSFWKVSTEFFGGEAHLDYAVEFMCFTIIGAISAWPIISMLVAVTRLVRNY
jgi:hypothetical protein